MKGEITINLKLRIALLLCLVSAAVCSVCGAYGSLHRAQAYELPDEITAQFILPEKDTAFFLRESGGYVAVFSGRREHRPVTVTEIETSGLRVTDRILLSRGIPVSGSSELLMLLEDLGS